MSDECLAPRIKQRARLQMMIDKCAAAHSLAFNHTSKLMEECQDRYGFEPGDVDCDEVIDAVLGGGGDAPGMYAEDFDRAMREAIERRGYKVR